MDRKKQLEDLQKKQKNIVNLLVKNLEKKLLKDLVVL